MLFENIIEVVDSEPHGAALNMAIDETLLLEASVPILRVYRWTRPSVSFGYFGKFDVVTAGWPNREIVRRWTGGGIVPHGNDITYTLIVPREAPFFRRPARESYRVIHERIALHLSRSGRAVSVAAQAGEKISDACFENPVVFDLVADGTKIAGAAQRRTQSGLLHQGSIVNAGATPDLRNRLAGVFGRDAERRELTPIELKRAQVLATQKYATDAWLRKF